MHSKSSFASQVEGLEIVGPMSAEYAEVLSAPALALIAKLEREFRGERAQLLQQRREVQSQLDAGQLPGFLATTKGVRESDWQVAPVPADLADRRVEITGPVDRKMIINALNSSADVFMADFEDSNTPTWDNTIQGQINLRDAVRRSIGFEDPRTGKSYSLVENPATLVVRPRGWHLDERHVLVDGKPVSGSIFDFALYLLHNGSELLQRGSGPYYYLPKLESHLEARLWNKVFVAAQKELGLPNGTVKATVLIETILAAFEMDEILFELRDHAAGLNCGRWDYIFSVIKKFRKRSDFVFPDRGLVGMDQHFLRSYSQLLIKTCHRRGAHAIGGMAAQIPIKNDAERNQEAMEKVRRDKSREAGDGHDGTWVAHPGLVALAREQFQDCGPNQLSKMRTDVEVKAEDLLRVPNGAKTLAGLRHNLRVGILYMESWLRGIGCVPIDNLMEDAATAEISRAQIWQWRQHNVVLDSGEVVDAALINSVTEDVMQGINADFADDAARRSKCAAAKELFLQLVLDSEFEDFLTSIAYEKILEEEQ